MFILLYIYIYIYIIIFNWQITFLGILTLLKYPYPRDVEEPDKYETVRVHAEWGKARDDSLQQKNSNLAVSAVIHEM